MHLNSAALTLLGGDLKQALHKRGGEALHCIHSTETPNGCGHAPACKNCVIRNSVNEAFQGKRMHREEAKLELVRDGSAYDSMLKSRPTRSGTKEKISSFSWWRTLLI